MMTVFAFGVSPIVPEFFYTSIAEIIKFIFMPELPRFIAAQDIGR